MAYSSLTALATAIAADAGENSATAPQTAFTVIGALERGRREGPPRVMWVPGDGELEPPEQDEDETSKIGYEHQVSCTIHFLGSSYDQAETLLKHWLAALQRTQGDKCALPGRTAYRDETLTGTNRHEIALTCVVKLPYAFETYTRGLVTGTAQTGTITE